jgi:TetR/AcrR family transcriptional regulator, lmrAB and yxaGH operons repressor
MSDTRSKILLTMARLIEKQGYHATSLNEIIRESGAPKGSVYYYFPDGKEQIGAEAIIESGKIIAGRLSGLLGQESSPAAAIQNFMTQLADNMETFDFALASPLTTATIETAVTCERINQACREAFDLILTAFKEKFQAGGCTKIQAAELAIYVTTVIEGGILMSRTFHQAEPLRLAARHLHAYLKNL